MKLYSCKAVESLLADLAALNYEIVQLREGGCGYGDIAAISPAEHARHFVIREVVLNCWSSAHTVRAVSKISKALQREIDAAQAQEDGAA